MRKSYTALNKIYFWTATIHKWYPLLLPNENKDLLLSYLRYLSEQGFITVFGFVIMPNHIHLIFRQNKLNGKENPKSSFLKYTAHELLKKLKIKGKSHFYEVNMSNKKHQIWQRDAMGIEIYSEKVAQQKLDYIHTNPVKGRWNLAKDYLSYDYSSVGFYETGIDEFGFLNNVFWELNGL